MLASARSRSPLLIAVVLFVALLGCSAPQQQQPDDAEATSTPVPAAVSSPAVAATAPSPSPTAQAAVVPAPSPSPAPPPPAASAPLVVRGTGADGLVMRREPGGDQIAVIDEGEELTDLDEERVVEGRTWRRVRAPDDTEGWVAAEFVASADEGPTEDAAPPDPAAAAPGEAEPAEPSSPGEAATGGPRGYVARSPEYGMNVFLAGNAATTDRDLALLNRLDFGWQKSLFQWRSIERDGKGEFDWLDSDRVVAASRDAGIKIIARLDFQPDWARSDDVSNGPPDDYEDYADFVGAFVERYQTGSEYGTVHAIEIWNEPNLAREWGGATIDEAQAADYVRLLRLAYQAAKDADPSVTVISAGLSPTCTDDATARPDDLYLQWMYDAGAAPYFDVLGAHGAGYDKPPSASPEVSAASHDGCRVFTFRRVEDLRAIMERNGDGGKQVWLLEFGWTTDQQHPAYSWFAVTPETQGDYVVDAFRWAHEHWAPWIGVMALWNFPDPNWDRDREEYWWGIVNPDGTARPAFTRLVEARQDGSLP